jgi:hypothetical protein
MATINRAPALIEPPLPPPRPYGLFDVALGPMPFPVDPAVGGGIQYQPNDCEDDVFLYAMNCGPAVSGSKTFSAVEPAISGNPFGVITSYQCGAIGYSFEEAKARVLTRMALREQTGVERRVWQGVPLGGIGGIPGLFQSAVTLPAASCPTTAVQALEQALADNGVFGGIIHARPNMAAQLGRSHLIETGPGRRISTYLGTPVVFGQGYNGTGPQGQAITTTTEYMYASGRILLWATDADVPDPRQTFDQVNNVMFTIAEKVYVAIVECGVWAVQVTYDCSTN